MDSATPQNTAVLAQAQALIHSAWKAIDDEVVLSGLFGDTGAPPTVAAGQARSVLHWVLTRLEVAELAMEQAAGGREPAQQLADALHHAAQAAAVTDGIAAVIADLHPPTGTCGSCRVPAPCPTAAHISHLLAARP